MATYKVPILGGDALNTGDLLRWNGSAWDTTTTPETARLTLTDVCSSADGANFLRVTGLQVDGTAMTGTLRGAYIDVSNGSTAATGTIRAMELKARTEAPGDTGNDVNVLEGLSISADSKGHSVTTMRAAEFILDGSSGGTITEAVGLRIANNLQANKATTSYGLQIYRDSFDYTADIQLSSGGLIGGSGGDLVIEADGDVVFSQDVKITGTAYWAAQQTATGDGTTTIDWGLGNKFYFTFGAANETFTFTAPGGPCNLILVLKQDGTGSRTATWPATVMWPGGTAPTLSTGAAAVDLISFYYDGTNYFGNSSLNYSVPA